MNNDFYYSVRLMLHHPVINPSEITKFLGMESDYEHSKINYTGRMNHYWNYSSYTIGEENFFEEIEDILNWLVKEKKEFIDYFILPKRVPLQAYKFLTKCNKENDTKKLEMYNSIENKSKFKQ